MRRPSELGKERGHKSSSTLAEPGGEPVVEVKESEPASPLRRESNGERRVEVEEEGDFMDLRDPFACPSALQGGSVRIMSSAELSIRTGRESRTGYRDDDIFEVEGAQVSRSVSYGKSSKGMRMSAWGRLPMSPPSGSSSPANSPHVPRYIQYGQQTPTPKSKKKGRSSKGSTKSSKAGSRRGSESAAPPGGGEEGMRVDGFEDGFVYEEALIAQQLLQKLDEKLLAASEEGGK
jgi:hypothetical protein